MNGWKYLKKMDRDPFQGDISIFGKEKLQALRDFITQALNDH